MRLQHIVLLVVFCLSGSKNTLASPNDTSTNHKLFAAIFEDMEISPHRYSTDEKIESLLKGPDIPPRFSQMEFLFVNNKKIRNLNNFPSMTKLGNLDISDNQISSLQGLESRYARLEFFVLDNNLLQDLSACPAHLERLVTFSASGNKLASLKGIPRQLPKLENLNLANNALKNLQFFPRLGRHIGYISLAGNEDLEDISPLIESLEEYRLEACQDLVIDLRSSSVPESQVELLHSLKGSVSIMHD